MRLLKTLWPHSSILKWHLLDWSIFIFRILRTATPSAHAVYFYVCSKDNIYTESYGLKLFCHTKTKKRNDEWQKYSLWKFIMNLTEAKKNIGMNVKIRTAFIRLSRLWSLPLTVCLIFLPLLFYSSMMTPMKWEGNKIYIVGIKKIYSCSDSDLFFQNRFRPNKTRIKLK